MSDIPFSNRYIYNLDEDLLNSLELLYFDSLTHEVRSKDQFLERRKEEIDNKEIKYTPKIVKPQGDLRQVRLAKLQSHLKKLEIASERNTDISDEETEQINTIEEKSEEDEEEEADDDEDDEDLDLYKRIESSREKDSSSEIAESTISFMATGSPQILFKSNKIDASKTFAIYKSLLSAKDSPNFDPLAHLKALSSQKLSNDPLKAGISAVFMLTSGHFAGAIISHLPHSTKGNQGSLQALQLQSVRMIQHKTFHRYTTRRKQGGSQSSMDDAKGKANSAGSTLRRYNEQALEQDISKLLNEWKVLLDECDHIFIRAMGKAGRLIVKQRGDSNGIIFNDDDRIKTIPFGTGRPTAMEIKKTWNELMYLKIVDYPKITVSEINKLKKKKQAIEKSQVTSKKVEDIAVINLQNDLISLLKKSKAPALLMYLKKNKVDVNTFKLNLPTTPTLLHYASAHGLSYMVKTLLLQARANPSLLNDRSKTAFQIAGSYGGDAKLVLWEFSLAKNQLSELDWSGAGDIQPMTSEEVETAKLKWRKEQDENSELRRIENQKALDAVMTAKLEQEKLEKSERYDQKFGKGQSIANMVVKTEEQKLAGLTPEQRMKVMREQRARAIEARMKKL